MDLDREPLTAAVSAMQIEARAVGLLARREHSRQELYYKLTGRGLDATMVGAVLDDLAEQNLQSDQRYAHSYVHSRVERGFGPLHIRAELQARGVDAQLIADALAEGAVDWTQCARAARDKRFGMTAPDDRKERARQTRFLQQRGYTFEQIHYALQALE